MWERPAEDSFEGTAGENTEEVFNNLPGQLLPVSIYARPDEVSGVAAFLAFRRARFVAGACGDVDGGFTKFLT